MGTQSLPVALRWRLRNPEILYNPGIIVGWPRSTRASSATDSSTDFSIVVLAMPNFHAGRSPAVVVDPKVP